MKQNRHINNHLPQSKIIIKMAKNLKNSGKTRRNNFLTLNLKVVFMWKSLCKEGLLTGLRRFLVTPSFHFMTSNVHEDVMK